MESIVLDGVAMGRVLALHERALSLRRTLCEASVELGEVLREIHSLGGYVLLQTTTFPLYCETRLGIAASEGNRLRAAALAFEAAPSLREKVLEKGVPLDSAAAVGGVLRDPALLRGDDRWEDLVSEKPSSEIRRMVQRRKTEARMGASVKKEIHLTPDGLALLGRAHEIVQQKLQRPALLDETVGFVVADFVKRHDPEAKAYRALEREMERLRDRGTAAGVVEALQALEATPDTGAPGGNGKKRSRAVPAGLKHAMILKYGDRCWVEGCDERYFLETSHREPFAYGGGHRPCNTCRYCRTHHKQRDAGLWTEVQERDGVALIDKRGITVGRLRRPPPP